MSAGYGPPVVNTFGMITGLGDAIGKSYDASRKQAQEDEAPAIFSKLVGIQSPDVAPATGGTLGTMGQSYRDGGTATAQPAKLPSFAGGGSAPMRVPGSGGEIETKFVDALKTGGLTNPYGLAAMAAYAGRESGYKGSNITGSWSDPSESGQPGTSGGILSWRGDRFANMRRLTAGAADPVTAQAKFALTENPELTLALQRAKSPEEANALMAQAWRFAGWNREGGENAARLASTRAYVASLGGATPPQAAAPQVVTADAPKVMPGAPAASGTMAQAPLPQMGTAVPAQVAAPSTVAGGDPDAANKPAPNAQPAGFVIPGQDAPAAQGFPGFGSPASRITPAQQEILTAAWKNPVTRPMATEIYGQLLKGKQSQWQLSTMGDQPVLFNQATAQIVPVGQAKRQTATVGNTVIDTATGQPIYQGERAPQSVSSGSALVDPQTGRVIYQAPEKDSDKLQSVAPGTTLFDPRARQPVYTAPPAEKPEKDEGAKINAQIEARKSQAAGLGLIEGTPAWQSFVGTGKIGRDQDLSATDKRAIQEADEGVLSAQTAIDALKQAKDLSPQAYSGVGAGMRGSAGSMVGLDAGVATEDLKNIVTTNALGQLKAIFGGNPTEGERAILLEIQGSVNQPDVVRQKIFDRGIALAQKSLDFNKRRAEDLRGGTYYKSDGATAGQQPRADRQVPSLPVKVSPLMKPQDVMKRYPSGTRLILPDGSEGVVP